MNMRLAGIFFIFFVSISLSTYSQSSNLIGDWKLHKHMVSMAEEEYDCAKLFEYLTLTFSSDSTYTLSLKEKNVDVWITFGKWKMTGDGKGILFYNNDSKPKRVNEFIANHIIPLTSANATKLVIEERLCTIEKPGTSYYMRVKEPKH